MTGQSVIFKVKRQDGPGRKPYYEEFEAQRRKSMNVISLLQEIQKNPVSRTGKKTTPVAFDVACLEDACGACSMVINGKPRNACSTLVENLSNPVLIEPLSRFPVIRDISVDRSRMDDTLRATKAWLSIDSLEDLGVGPRESKGEAALRYSLSKCTVCGICMEACPRVTERGGFIGAFAINNVRLKNLHPRGADEKSQRLDVLLEDGGIEACGNNQNCVRVCPEGLPLTESIGLAFRSTLKHSLKKFFSRED